MKLLILSLVLCSSFTLSALAEETQASANVNQNDSTAVQKCQHADEQNANSNQKSPLMHQNDFHGGASHF